MAAVAIPPSAVPNYGAAKPDEDMEWDDEATLNAMKDWDEKA